MGLYDLHAHTTASDGGLSPQQLVELALRCGVKVLAVTDHDTIASVIPCQEAAQGSGLEVWAGVEISADVPASEVHMLGYFINPNHSDLRTNLEDLRRSRLERGTKMVARLNKLGMDITWERVQEIAGDASIGRPHIAQALLEKGYVSTMKDAFSRLIGRNGPAYVERTKLTPAESVALIREAGGFASLAHPQYVMSEAKQAGRLINLDSFIEELVESGLEGIEVYYPDLPTDLQNRLLNLADRYKLITTGGTDFHGLPGQLTRLGDVQIPDGVIAQMREWNAARLASN